MERTPATLKPLPRCPTMCEGGDWGAGQAARVDIAKGIPRICKVVVTPATFGYPPSSLNTNSTLKAFDAATVTRGFDSQSSR